MKFLLLVIVMAKFMGIEISTEFPKTEMDTLTLYLSSKNQKQYYNNIINLNPKRIIFNPGAENEELSLIAQAKRY